MPGSGDDSEYGYGTKCFTITHTRDSYTEPNWFFKTEKLAKFAINTIVKRGGCGYPNYGYYTSLAQFSKEGFNR